MTRQGSTDEGASSGTVLALGERLEQLAEEVGRYGPRSVPTALRTEHVLTAATLAFVRDGFDGTSMDRIADLAHVSKPVVYSLYESKEALFAAVIDRSSDELSERLRTAVGPAGVAGSSPLERGVRAYLDYVVARQHLWGRLLVSSNHRAVTAAVDRLRAQQVDVVAAAVRDARQARGLPTDRREADAIATGLVGAIDAMGRWWLVNDDVDLDTLVTFITSTVRPMTTADGSLRQGPRG